MWCRAMELVDQGMADTLCAWHIDRLYRQPRELEELIDRADKGVVRVATLYGELDLSNADGRAMARVLVAISAKSSDDASRRMRRVLAERRSLGLPFPGAAFGWIDGMTPNPEQAAILRELYARVKAGESIYALARDLNERGIQTLRNKGGWSTGIVRNMLASPRNAGLVSHRDRVTGEVEIVRRGLWPAIVDRKTFDRVGAIIAARNVRQRNPRRQSLLTGLVRCGQCGETLTRSRAHSTKKYLLICKANQARVNCGGCAILFEIVENVVTTPITAWVDTTDVADMTRIMGTKQSTKVIDELVDVESLGTDHAEMFAAGKLLASAYAKSARLLEARREKLISSLSTTTSIGIAIPYIGAARGTEGQVGRPQHCATPTHYRCRFRYPTGNRRRQSSYKEGRSIQS